MSNYKKEIIKVINTKLKQKLPESIIETPPNQEHGDFAFPCFILSKKLKKSPQEIAKDLSKLKYNKIFEKIQPTGPYLNFFINKTESTKQTIQNILKEKQKYGFSNIGKNKKVMIEFSQPNTH